MLLQGKSKGHFNNLFQFIKNNDNEQFFKFTRMTVKQFEMLLEVIQESLRKKIFVNLFHQNIDYV